MVVRFFPHLSLLLGTTDCFCLLSYNPGHRLWTNAHHTSYGSLRIVRMSLKGKNASRVPKCDIGHPVLQIKQLDCYFTTPRKERLLPQ